MTATTTEPPSVADTPPDSPAPPPVVDPGERGRLRIDPSVLRKVAAHVADRTPGALPTPRTVAGIGLGSAGATVRVAVTGQRVDLNVELALGYPGPVRATVEQLRGRVGDELRRITGYQVRSIAVTVTALLPEPGSRLG
ncbi:MAG: Asp23/Gls24 family envelope stress response protein [Pseudonocardiaceae bacterium]